MKKTPTSVRDYLRMVFRRKWLLALPTLAGMLSVPLVISLITPEYRAEALVRRRDMSALRQAPSSLVSGGYYQVPLSALRIEILTWENLERVIRETKQDSDLHTAEQWQRKYLELRRSIFIERVAKGRGDDWIEIAAISRDPQLAQKVANFIANNYAEESRKTGTEDLQKDIKFLKEQKETYLGKLHEAEDELDKYMQEHLANLPQVKDGIRQRLFDLETRRTAAQFELAAIEDQLAEVENQMEAVPGHIETEVTTERNPMAVELENQLTQRKRALAALSARYTAEHPQVEAMKREVAELEEQLKDTPARLEGLKREVVNPLFQELASQQLSLQQQVRGHRAALRGIDATIEANNKALEKIASQEKRYTDLVREKGEHDELYNMYRKNLTATRTRLEVEVENYGTQVEVVQSAQLPAIPYRRGGIKVAFATVGGGLAVGVALMFLLEFTDRSLRNIEDAATFLKIPVLSSIPVIVPAAELQRRRRRRWAVLGVLLAFLAGSVAGLFLWDRVQPGAPRELWGDLWERMQTWFRL